MEKFSWNWKYPDQPHNKEIIFDNIFNEHGLRICCRDKNGKWSGYLSNFEVEMEKEYKHYIREQKLKRILNGKI